MHQNIVEAGTNPRPGGTRYLRQPELLARVGVSWITVLRWEKKDLFPKRRRLGPNVVAWIEDEIDQWCASREIANSEQGS